MVLIFRRETSNKVNQKSREKDYEHSVNLLFLSNVEGGIFRNIRDLGALKTVLLPLLYSLS